MNSVLGRGVDTEGLGAEVAGRGAGVEVLLGHLLEGVANLPPPALTNNPLKCLPAAASVRTPFWLALIALLVGIAVPFVRGTLALVGVAVALVSVAVAFVRGTLALVGVAVALVSVAIAFVRGVFTGVGETLAQVCFPVTFIGDPVAVISNSFPLVGVAVAEVCVAVALVGDPFAPVGGRTFAPVGGRLAQQTRNRPTDAGGQMAQIRLSSALLGGVGALIARA